ncbi:hypothetical protein BpHYR1_021252 [Brachionus plicatilis]|uniref:Uncharacterized protein n=1 Tax=Brachionus plicatilis TaxID=10195 RepID=A0A3M7RAE3_BRAPC|nr:hypothetical protein BpHYR1_021252 [Brachionus plicatilis]
MRTCEQNLLCKLTNISAKKTVVATKIFAIALSQLCICVSTKWPPSVLPGHDDFTQFIWY